MANQNNFVVKNGLTVGSTQVIDGSTNITTTGVTINTVNVASALVYSSNTANTAYSTANSAYITANAAFAAANSGASAQNAYNTANAAYATANAAFAKANTGGGGGGSGNTIVTVTSTNKLITATAGQTVFVTPTYTVGANQLSVFIDGVAQAANTDYTETTTTSITFNTGLAAGDLVYVQVSGYSSSNVAYSTMSSVFANTTATAGQTVFNTPVYSPGSNQVEVFINGVAQLPGYDYTETSTSSITLTTAATAGDVVMARVFTGFISAPNGLLLNSNTVSSSYTLPAGTNAISVGPMTIANTANVTVGSTSRWVIL